MAESNKPADGGVNPVLFALHVAWRYHLLLVFCGLVGVGVGVFRAATMQNTYRSLGKLYVWPSVRENLTAESAIAGSTASRMLNTREAIANELQVLATPQLYKKVLEKVGVDGILAPYAPMGGGEEASLPTRLFHGFQEWWFQSAAAAGQIYDREFTALEVLRDTLLIYPEANTTVLNVVYLGNSPQQAKRVVDAALAAAIEVHSEVLDAASSLQTVLTELASEEKLAREAEEKLRKFRLEKEIYDYEAQRVALIQHLADLVRQNEQLELDLRRRQAERTMLQKILGTVPLKRPVDGQVTVNPEFTRLTTLLTALQAEDLQLELAKARGGDPAVYKTQKDLLVKLIGETQASLQQESPTIPPPEIDHPRRLRIVELLDEIDVALEGLAEQRKHVTSERSVGMKRLADFEALSPELRQLELDATQRRTMTEKLAESVVSLKTVERLNQLNLSPVQILHDGTSDPNKIAPVRSKLLVYGAVGGAAVGGALALLLAFLDRRVRNLQDLRRAGLRGRVEVAVGGSDRGVEALFGGARADSRRWWRFVPYDREAKGGIALAVVPSGADADVGAVAADLAVGLARHGGERVILIDVGGAPGLRHAAAADAPGWRQAVRGECDAERAAVATATEGLLYLPAGPAGDSADDPAALLRLLDRLCGDRKFVVLALGDLEASPTSAAVARSAEGGFLVAKAGAAMREQVTADAATMAAVDCRLLATILQRG
ncbi:MAG: hypothetical protein RL398_3001 [Planctomycetota bacterium]|jgi:uncharacterized protein involved in exopolysaccharide biosynthesis